MCPICIYEVNLMKGRLSPPYFVISFYPGIPIKLLDSIDIDIQGPKYSVKEEESYLKAFKEMGGVVTTSSQRKVLASYLGAKVIIRATDLTLFKLSTRLSKTDLNSLLPYAPMLSVIFLTSPVMISTNIYDVPSGGENVVSVSSFYNYSFIKPLGSNLSTLYSLFSYTAKYSALRKICRNDLDNCLNYLVAEADLYSSVDPSLGVLSIGMGVGTPLDLNDKFFNNLLPISGYLLKAAGVVGGMGEKIKDSIFSIAYALKEVVNQPNASKYDIIGFMRDGVDMFFRSSTVIRDKEDRIGIAVNAAISSLENKYTLNDKVRAQIFSALQNLFGTLHEVEERADRGLALSIANTLTNWLYIAYKLVVRGEKS